MGTAFIFSEARVPVRGEPAEAGLAVRLDA